MPDESVHLHRSTRRHSRGSYHYSSSDRDLSNARNYDEFFDHYGYVVAETSRDSPCPGG